MMNLHRKQTRFEHRRSVSLPKISPAGEISSYLWILCGNLREIPNYSYSWCSINEQDCNSESAWEERPDPGPVRPVLLPTTKPILAPQTQEPAPRTQGPTGRRTNPHGGNGVP